MNGWYITAIVFSILGCPPVGLVFLIIGYLTDKPPKPPSCTYRRKAYWRDGQYYERGYYYWD